MDLGKTGYGRMESPASAWNLLIFLWQTFNSWKDLGNKNTNYINVLV